MLNLPQPGTTIAERYRVEEMLGAGAMGTVWAVADARTGRSLALKLIMLQHVESPEAVLRFLNEARATAKIDHPNVVSVLDVGRIGQAPFLVMERLRGETLKERIERGPMTPVEAIEIAIAACRGVAEAHAEGVIHRDLKPANIFLARDPDGRVVPKVLDFGVAKLIEGRVGGSITQTGVMLGTPAYMPPEHIGAARDADARGDVYSMGVVLYEMITRRLPYDAGDVMALVRKVVEARAPHLRTFAPDVPRGLDAVVRRAMSADRERRQSSMPELMADLEPFRETRAPHAVTSPRPRPVTSQRPHRVTSPRPQPAPAPPPARRSLLLPLLAGLGGVLALAIVMIGVVLAFALRPRDPPPRREPVAQREAPIEPPSERNSTVLPGLAPERNPRQPTVDLQFSEGCAESRLDERTTVRGQSQLVTMVQPGVERTAVVVSVFEGHTLPFTVSVEHMRASGIMVNVVENVLRFSSSLAGAGRAGSVTLREWDPVLGLMHIELDGLRIRGGQNDQFCTIRGSIQTRGNFNGVL